MFHSLDSRRRGAAAYLRGILAMYLGFTGDQGGGERLQVQGDIYCSGKIKAAGTPHLSVFLTTAQAQTGSGATTRVDFDTVTTDTNGWWDAGNKRYTPQIAGRYQITAGIYNTIGGTLNAGQQVLEGYIRKNGGIVSTGIVKSPVTNPGSFAASTQLHKTVSMNGTTDYIDVAGYTDNIASNEFIGGSPDLGRNFLQIEYIGP